MLALLGNDSQSSRRDQLVSLWNDDGASETLHESWKNSRLFGALETLLSNPDGSSQSHGKRNREDNAFANSDDKWTLRVVPNSTSLGPEAPRVICPSSQNAKRARLGSTDTAPPLSPANAEALQLPAQASQLLDSYFAITHTWFPVVAKSNILRASYLYANAPVSVTNLTESGDHAALWAILSYTLLQSSGEPDRISKANEYYSIARKLIPSEKDRHALGHVQALLLLTLVNVGLNDLDAAWLLHGQAVGMAANKELATNSNAQRSDETRLQNCVLQGCFVIDSLLSFRLGRSPCMHTREIKAMGSLEEDGLEEWNSWSDILPLTRGVGGNPPPRGPLLALSCFNRLVELSNFMNQSVRNIPGEKGYKPTEVLVGELKEWEHRLPAECRVTGSDPERCSPLLPHQTYLALTSIAMLLTQCKEMIPTEEGLKWRRRTYTKRAREALDRVLPLLSQHMENFSICSVPPIFEASLSAIAREASVVIPATPFQSFSQWARELQQKLKRPASMWPVFESLVDVVGKMGRPADADVAAMSHEPAPPTMSNTPSNVFNSGINLPPITQANQRGRSDSSHALDQTYPSSILGMSMPMDTNYTTRDTAMENADFPIPSASQEQHQYRHRSSSFLDLQPRGGDIALSTPDSSLTNFLPTFSTPQAGDIDLPDTDPTASSSTSSIDAIFTDLAYLDTTSWADTRAAGLRDFGFLDDTTFQAFCHDPDRLVGSQPLVHPQPEQQSIADIWPPPGFFPETFLGSGPASSGRDERMGE